MKKEMSSLKNKHSQNNKKAIVYIMVWLLFTASGFVLSLYFNWWIGQIMLGVGFFQAFILLHETGHYSLFKSKKINKLFGHLFGFISFIPFISWVDMHNLHHKWTGWRDKDPTTVGTVNPKHGFVLKSVVNISWFLFLPLFTIGYRIDNYWNLRKIKTFAPKTNRKRVLFNLLIIILIWTLLIILFTDFYVSYVLPAFLIGLMMSDLIILSQHSHIDIPVSNGKDVKPLKHAYQVKYSRSIRVGSVFENWVLFNFNMHEKHHAYPGVPSYYLPEMQCEEKNTRNFWTFICKAKLLSGENFVFSTTKKTNKML
ncbi:fatty acid desaturase family protein [Ascidiimonas sp. W6]|uniref:fatty acid desaturase family protein n=1 Tax=Ascidiimonas meishanensis TaxID=3128903 RepID=UPI0030EEF930